MRATWCKASHCLLAHTSSCAQNLTVMPSLFQQTFLSQSSQVYSVTVTFNCIACSRVHDRTVSHIRYLPDEGLIATLAFDNTLRIFNAIQATLRCTVVNDTGGPFTGMEHDPVRSQVCSGPFPCNIRAVSMQGYPHARLFRAGLFSYRAFQRRAVPMQGCSHAGAVPMQGCSHAGLSPCRAFPMQGFSQSRHFACTTASVSIMLGVS